MIVKVTVPAKISAAEVVYTAVADVASLKVPVPEVVQVNELAPPPIAPANVFVSELQIVASAPALAVALGLTVIVNVFAVPVQETGIGPPTTNTATALDGTAVNV